MDQNKCKKFECRDYECLDVQSSSSDCDKFELKDFKCIGEDEDVQYNHLGNLKQVRMDTMAEQEKRKCKKFEGTEFVCLDGTQPPTQPPPAIFHQCIPITKRCDGVNDCKKGSDEANCPHGMY